MSPLPTLLFLTGGGALIVWLLVFAGAMVATRPRAVRPDPPTEIFDNTRPAVVNLLTNRWRCTMDAARATLVDLVARGYLEVHRDGPDPAQTVIEIRHTDPPSLTRYERRLMSRLWALSRKGEVTLPALAFRTRRAASRWLARFASEVAADARARDVARAGINTDFMSATALVPALTLGGWTYLRVPSDQLFSAVAVFVALLLALHQLAVQVRERHRPTPPGRALAAYWLGVRAYLRKRQPELADLTLCQIQERRAGYAVALGVATALSEQLQFAPVRDRRVVTPDRTLLVRFPDRMRFCWGWGGLGCATAAATALFGAVFLGTVLRWYGGHLPVPVDATGWLLVWGLSVACAGLVGLAVADVAATSERTGTVVLFEGYGHDSARDPRLESRYVLALAAPILGPDQGRNPDPATDPGRGQHPEPGQERVTVPAWILPSYLGDGLTVGCTVTARVRRWTGLVVQLAIVRAPGIAAPRSPAETGNLQNRRPETTQADTTTPSPAPATESIEASGDTTATT